MRQKEKEKKNSFYFNLINYYFIFFHNKKEKKRLVHHFQMSRGGSRGRGIRAVPALSSTPPTATATTAMAPPLSSADDQQQQKRLSMSKIFGTNSIDSAEQRLAFLQWCKSMEIYVHPEVHLGVDIKGMGRGVVAGTKLKKGTSLLLVPQRALLSPSDPLTGSEAHRNSPVVPLLNEALKKSQMPKVTDFTRVVLRLMSEVSRRKHSPWFPWITMCPVMGTAIWELPADCIAGTDVGHAVEDRDVPGQWELVKPVVESNPAAFVPPLNTHQLYLECVSQVASRNFHLEYHEQDSDLPDGPFLKLVPVVDFLNHNPDINAVLKMHGGRGRAPLQLELLCCRDVEAGEQVMFSYSDASSGRFLAEFQFVPRCTPNDSIRISQPQLIEFCSKAGNLQPQDVAERVKLLDNGNMIYREGVFVPQRETEPATTSGSENVTTQQQHQLVGAHADVEVEDDDEGVDDEDEQARKRSGLLTKSETEEIEVWNAIAVLTMSKEEYSKVVPTVQKWWRCDRKDERIKNAVTNVLGRRIAVAMACERACTERVAEAKKRDEETKAGVDSQVAPTLFMLIDQCRREQRIISGFLERTVEGFRSAPVSTSTTTTPSTISE